MIIEERQIRILQILKEKQFISVNELVEQLHASRSSIIRDLNALEKQGRLTRQRGGASLLSSEAIIHGMIEPTVFEKESVNVKKKQDICAWVAQKIQKGQCIYVDSGSTTRYLLPYLVDKQVTLVTPSVFLLRNLPDDFQGEVFLLGGRFDARYDMSTGPLSQQMLKQFRFDISFMTANGLNADNHEIYSADFGLGSIKAEVLKRSQQSILLVDDSKFAISAICQWATMEDFDLIVTNVYPKKKKPKNVMETEGEKNENNQSKK